MTPGPTESVGDGAANTAGSGSLRKKGEAFGSKKKKKKKAARYRGYPGIEAQEGKGETNVVQKEGDAYSSRQEPPRTLAESFLVFRGSRGPSKQMKEGKTTRMTMTGWFGVATSNSWPRKQYSRVELGKLAPLRLSLLFFSCLLR